MLFALITSGSYWEGGIQRNLLKYIIIIIQKILREIIIIIIMTETNCYEIVLAYKLILKNVSKVIIK